MPANPDKLKALSAKARALPRVPGVYLMKDAQGRVIYIGKAINLPNRVATYFQASTDLGPKKQPMIDLIDDFDTIECAGEWEALLTENRLIKDLHPRFNARLTDDKSFPYLVVTMRDDYPGVFITRQPGDPQYKGARILGPFTSVNALRESSPSCCSACSSTAPATLDIRWDPAPGEEHNVPRKHFRPCLLHAIDQCTAPCAANRIDRKEAYRADIDRFVRFITSKRSDMLREMRQDMAAAAESMDYETAAVLRDQINAIEKLDERGKHKDRWQPETESFYVDPRRGLRSLQKTLGLSAEIRCIECIDIAHLQGKQTVGSKVCFVDGRPLKNEYRRYKINTATNDDYMSIREVVSRAYRDAGSGDALFPDVIMIDGGAGQLTAALEAIETFERKPATVIALAKAEELIYKQGSPEPIRLSRNNLGLKLCQAVRDEAHRFAQAYHHLLRKKDLIDES